jgi:heptosyltransferase I
LRVLIVKLSSLGDVVHAMPVVADISAAHPQATINWVVEPAFAPLVRRVEGVGHVIECALRRWRGLGLTPAVFQEGRAFFKQLRAQRYDAVIDLQGLTKSALMARLAHGPSHGLANQTEGSSFERPARWLVHHPIYVAPHTHALDRSRQLAARALGYSVQGPPLFGLGGQVNTAGTHPPTLALVHGSSRADKLWPLPHWVTLGQRAVAEGWRIALPHAGAIELQRAQQLQQALGSAAEVWPAMALDALARRLAATQGVVGVDSGVSHMAVALNLPHVQIYNFATAWRTGPQVVHGHRHQVSVEGQPTPTVDAVWQAWMTVLAA